MRDEKQQQELHRILDELRKPFHPSSVTWKPGAVKGERALALAYADLRAYMNRLDEVCGSEWSVEYEPWGDDRIICRLTVCGVTRSSTGEMSKESERSEIGGTVAEAQSFKRAATMFGCGRYLYNLPSGWYDYDPAAKKFTEKAKAKLMGILVQHYRRATDGDVNAPDAPHSATTQVEGDGTPPHQRCFGVGLSVFGPAWNNGGRKWLLRAWSKKVTPDSVRESLSDFSDDEKTLLADYVTEHAKDLQRIWHEYEAEKAKKEIAA